MKDKQMIDRTIADDNEHTPFAAMKLNKDGFIHDGEYFGSTLIESNAEEIERVVRAHGYTGGPLNTLGAYGSEGAFYIAYDTDRLEPDDATSLVKNISNGRAPLSR